MKNKIILLLYIIIMVTLSHIIIQILDVKTDNKLEGRKVSSINTLNPHKKE